MDLLVQYGVNLTQTQWIIGTVMMQLRNWSSATHQLTICLTPGSLLSPIFYNVYTKGLAVLNQNGLSRVITLADDGLIIYKTTRDTHEAAEAVQQLENVSQWCQDTGSLISPSKAQTLWCTPDNRASGKTMPAVTVDGAAVQRNKSFEKPLGPLRQNADLQTTCGNNTEVQERPVSPEGYGSKGH